MTLLNNICYPFYVIENGGEPEWCDPLLWLQFRKEDKRNEDKNFFIPRGLGITLYRGKVVAVSSFTKNE